MDEILQEFVTSAGVTMRVDRTQGVIRGVKLLGLASRNGRQYLHTALTQAAPLYEGAKVNVNHPKGHPLAARDYQDRLGAIRNVSVREDGLFGDLHYNPKHALAEQLAWDAEHAADNVGFSHNVEARTARRAGQTVVEAIVKVQSVDLVADPATTRGLYESAGTATEPNQQLTEALAELSLEQLRAARPDLVEAIGAELAARLNALEGEVDRLHALEAAAERRQLLAQLLVEFKLPDLQTADPTARALVSEHFVETVLAASDEAAMRALVRERAEMIASARQFDGTAARPSRPRSRAQNQIDDDAGEVYDALSFARAIS